MKLSRENVQPLHGSSFACLDFDLPEFDHDHHYHPEVELTWIVESEGERQVGDSIEAFQEGDIVLIGENLPHRYRNWKSGRARSKVIQFKPDLFGADFFKLSELAQIAHLLNEANRGLTFSDTTNASVRRQINKIFNTAPGPIQITRLIELLHTLSEDNERTQLASIIYAEPTKLKKIDRLQRVLNYLEAHWQDPVTLNEAAQIAALHPQSMSRFFQQHLGMTFQEYLVQLRLGRAAKLLLETNRTIADIAFDSGFNNLANFNRHFQKFYNQTPSVYRNR
ncbi:AraC family transcriptional regulator [Rubellicoccus peritrichatus]|uniref:AraC family transcriptional regulator n=1 Tax=Rubellicoccus peritrichatus TaxID=3080537 RepID=A0AAQ3QUT8_9BACT|nr:AraC family transcriptional regulator [Puniceicoccus sp. CR14]WOO40127.1 AraC family transcriptional regulator [Puniceicoccus sp. CR14]